MRKTIRSLFACCLLLAGCNGDRFVEEDILSGIPETVDVRCGEPAVIRFRNDDWELRSDTSYDFGLVKFTLERTAPDELTIRATECLYDEPYDFQLKIDMGEMGTLTTATVGLRIQPGAKYVADSITYDWGKFHYSKNVAEEGELTIIRNASSKPVTWTVRPYKGAVFTQWFTGMENPNDVPSVFGTPMPEVAVPDADEEGRPVLRGRLLPFSPMLQIVPMDDDPTEERITVGAGEAVRVEVWLNVEEYDVPFTLHASNPESGGKRTYTGTYRYHRPYDYFILKREPGDAP